MGDLERLQREVRTLRRMVYALGACALALAAATVASCAHTPEPAKLSFVEGTHTVTIEASGIHISDGAHRVDLLPGVVGASDQLQVFGQGSGSVDILPNQVGIHDGDGLATLAVHGAIGPELLLTANAKTTLSAHAGSGFAGMSADNGTRKIGLEANTDFAGAVFETRGGPRATISSTNDVACASLARNRPAAERAQPGDTLEMCAPPAK